ncbi:MAG: hypothetical protein ACK58T_14890, partial [Phycisphaerae bacterium]
MPVFSNERHWHSQWHTRTAFHHSMTDNALVRVQDTKSWLLIIPDCAGMMECLKFPLNTSCR